MDNATSLLKTLQWSLTWTLVLVAVVMIVVVVVVAVDLDLHSFGGAVWLTPFLVWEVSFSLTLGRS